MFRRGSVLRVLLLWLWIILRARQHLKSAIYWRRTTFLLLGTTDRLQPMDIYVNKLAKEYLKKQFDEWYSEMVMQQLEGKDVENLEGIEIQPISDEKFSSRVSVTKIFQ